jgi:hypothetical protein
MPRGRSFSGQLLEKLLLRRYGAAISPHHKTIICQMRCGTVIKSAGGMCGSDYSTKGERQREVLVILLLLVILLHLSQPPTPDQMENQKETTTCLMRCGAAIRGLGMRFGAAIAQPHKIGAESSQKRFGAAVGADMTVGQKVLKREIWGKKTPQVRLRALSSPYIRLGA